MCQKQKFRPKGGYPFSRSLPSIMTNKRLVIIILSILWLAWMCSGLSRPGKGAAYKGLPDTIGPRHKYLFYMHGAWIEMNGLHKPHPRYGKYEYEKIVRALSDRGFEVISEPRLNRVDMRYYAQKITMQARDLIGSGIAPENITIVGHSKGGIIALLVSSALEEMKVNFVIMAGCGKKETKFRGVYERFLENRAPFLRGRLLSLYDRADRTAGTCQEAFSAASQIYSKEIVFYTGRGHGLFYAPESIWIKEVAIWTGLQSQ